MVSERIAPAERKALCNQYHAERRARSRYSLHRSTLKDVASSIRSFNHGEPSIYRVEQLKQFDDGRSLYAVLVDAEWIPVVFCHKTDTPVTVLPETALEGYGQVLRREHARQPSAEKLMFIDVHERLRVATMIIETIYSKLKSTQAMQPFNAMAKEFLRGK